MRIGIFTDSYGSNVNGIAVLTRTLKRSFEDLGHQVKVIAPKDISILRRTAKEDNVLNITSVSGIFFEDQSTSIYVSRLMVKKIAKMDLDIILTLTPGQIGLLGLEAAHRLDIPLVSMYTTDLYNYIKIYRRVSPAIFAMIMLLAVSIDLSYSDVFKLTKSAAKYHVDEQVSQALIRSFMTVVHDQAAAVIAPSFKLQKQIKSWGTKTPIHTIPCGVDRPKFSGRIAHQLRKNWGVQDDEKVILYLGRIAKEKSPDLLVDAFEIVAQKDSKSKLVFVGGFNYKDELEERCAKLACANRIIFAGKLAHADVGSAYEAADIFAFPSLTDTQGLSLHEAAASGLPIVMIDREVNQLVIPGKTGFFAANNPSSFAKELLNVLQLSDQKYQLMSNNIKLEAAKYSESIQSQKMIELFENILANRTEKEKS